MDSVLRLVLERIRAIVYDDYIFQVAPEIPQVFDKHVLVEPTVLPEQPAIDGLSGVQLVQQRVGVRRLTRSEDYYFIIFRNYRQKFVHERSFLHKNFR
jgi:hypothetical protein